MGAALSRPMDAQLSLLAFAPPPRRFWRLVRATTRQAWYLVRDTLPAREQAIYFGLMAYWNRYQTWPTALELLEFLLELKQRHPRHPRYRGIVDVNSVRPRLTGLNQHEPPLVVTGAPRLCTSRQARQWSRRKPVHVWRIPQVGE